MPEIVTNTLAVGERRYSFSETVTDTMDRFYVGGVALVGFNLLSQAHDVDINGPVADDIPLTAGEIQQLIAVEHCLRVFGERSE